MTSISLFNNLRAIVSESSFKTLASGEPCWALFQGLRETKVCQDCSLCCSNKDVSLLSRNVRAGVDYRDQYEIQVLNRHDEQVGFGCADTQARL